MAEPPRLLPLAAEREVDVPAASANMRAWVISACLNTACMVAAQDPGRRRDLWRLVAWANPNPDLARTRAAGGTCGGWSRGWARA